MSALDDRVDAMIRRIEEGRAREPYTGAGPTFRCGHPRTPENTHRNGSSSGRCATCSRERSAGRYEPTLCRTCGTPLGGGQSLFCGSDCEPTTCTCDTPAPDGLGECQNDGCHRLVLTHSWHEGRPDAGERVA